MKRAVPKKIEKMHSVKGSDQIVDNYSYYCCIRNCCSTAAQFKMYPFPLYRQTRLKWLENTAFTMSALKMSVCALHFDGNDYYKDPKTGKKNLKLSAYPHLNLPAASLICCFLKCPNGNAKTITDYSQIFPFPKINTCERWLAILGMSTVPSRFGVCKNHFSSIYFEIDHITGTKILKEFAVPLLNLQPPRLPKPQLICCVQTCPNAYSNKKNVNVFYFPVDKVMRNIWVTSTGLASIHVQPSYGVCARHFDAKDFSSVTKKLLPEAYPHLNLPPGISVEEYEPQPEIETTKVHNLEDQTLQDEYELVVVYDNDKESEEQEANESCTITKTLEKPLPKILNRNQITEPKVQDDNIKIKYTRTESSVLAKVIAQKIKSKLKQTNHVHQKLQDVTFDPKPSESDTSIDYFSSMNETRTNHKLTANLTKQLVKIIKDKNVQRKSNDAIPDPQPSTSSMSISSINKRRSSVEIVENPVPLVEICDSDSDGENTTGIDSIYSEEKDSDIKTVKSKAEKLEIKSNEAPSKLANSLSDKTTTNNAGLCAKNPEKQIDCFELEVVDDVDDDNNSANSGPPLILSTVTNFLSLKLRPEHELLKQISILERVTRNLIENVNQLECSIPSYFDIFQQSLQINRTSTDIFELNEFFLQYLCSLKYIFVSVQRDCLQLNPMIRQALSKKFNLVTFKSIVNYLDKIKERADALPEPDEKYLNIWEFREKIDNHDKFDFQWGKLKASFTSVIKFINEMFSNISKTKRKFQLCSSNSDNRLEQVSSNSLVKGSSFQRPTIPIASYNGKSTIGSGKSNEIQTLNEKPVDLETTEKTDQVSSHRPKVYQGQKRKQLEDTQLVKKRAKKYPAIILIEPNIKLSDDSISKIRSVLETGIKSISVKEKGTENFHILFVRQFNTVFDGNSLDYRLLTTTPLRYKTAMYLDEAKIVQQEILREVKAGTCDFIDKIVLIQSNAKNQEYLEIDLA